MRLHRAARVVGSQTGLRSFQQCKQFHSIPRSFRHTAELAIGFFRASMACAAASTASAMEEQCGMYVRGAALELNPQAAACARRSTQARRRHGAPRAVPGRGSRRRHRPRRGAEAPAELDFSALLSLLLQYARERAAARPPAAERRPTVAPLGTCEGGRPLKIVASAKKCVFSRRNFMELFERSTLDRLERAGESFLRPA